MKRVTVLLAALLLVLVAASPAAAKNPFRPFKGSAQGYGMVVPDAGCPALGLRSVFTATGQATHMGRLRLDYYNCTPVGPDIVGIEMTFVAASGDKVFAAYTAGSVPEVGADPMVIDITLDFVIVDGTGRFTGATGEGRMMATIAWPGFEPNYWPTTIVLDGTISY